MSAGVRQFDDSAHTPTALHANTSHSPGEVNTTPGRCPQWSAGLTNARACARPQTQPCIRTYHTAKAMSAQDPTGVGGCHKRDFDGCRQVSAIMLHLRCSSWWDGARRRGWRCRGSLSCRSPSDPEVLVHGSTDKTAAALQSSQALHIGIPGAWRGGATSASRKAPSASPSVAVSESVGPAAGSACVFCRFFADACGTMSKERSFCTAQQQSKTRGRRGIFEQNQSADAHCCSAY